MVLSRLTWPEVEALDREVVVLIPTGSCEQHGPALPLFTDTYIVTAVAEGVERALPDRILLTPTLWLGGSGHHLKFAGTLSNHHDAYVRALQSVVESLAPHGFRKFYVLNGHGGNVDLNGIALRELKVRNPHLTVGMAGYYEFVVDKVAELMEGPQKQLRHSCEAETSIMMYLQPSLVRHDRLIDDGLTPEPAIRGLIHSFDETTEHGVLGYATYANREKGQAIVDAATEAVARELGALAEGYVLRQP